jgi:hypothetical protein
MTRSSKSGMCLWSNRNFFIQYKERRIVFIRFVWCRKWSCEKKVLFFLSRNKLFAIIEVVIDFYSNKKEWLRYSLISSSKNFIFSWYLSHLYSSLNPSLCAKRKKNNHLKENTNHVNNKFMGHLCLSLKLFKHRLNQLRSSSISFYRLRRRISSALTTIKILWSLYWNI